MKTDEMIDFIKIDDIDLASVLYCLGFGIDGIYSSGTKNRFGKEIMMFYFRDEPAIRKAMMDFQLRKLRLEPNELFNTRKELLNKIKNEAST